MPKPRNTKSVNGVQHNQCTKCGEWFPAITEYFHRWNISSYGLSSKCKNCAKQYDMDRYEQRKNDPEYRAYRREYDKRPYVKEKRKIWEEENKDALLDYYKWYNKQNKEKRKKQQKENYQKNSEVIKEKAKVHRVKNKKKIKSAARIARKSPAKYKTFAHQLTIDEDPKEDENGYILVKCAYCGRYFIPTNAAMSIRVQGLSGTTSGENRLYCSDGCKLACPIYHRKTWPKGYKKASSREVDPLIRQMCLARDNYECQKCGKTIEETELHAHHIEGATQMPLLANDVENTITLCKSCHKWVHSQEGCKYFELRCK